VHLISLVVMILIILAKRYKLQSLLCSFLQHHIISSLLGPNVLQSTLFPNTFSLCSSLRPRDQVLHPGRSYIAYTGPWVCDTMCISL
jgi:hypothetical protein